MKRQIENLKKKTFKKRQKRLQNLQERTKIPAKKLPAPLQTLQRAFKMLMENEPFCGTYADKS